MQIRFALNEAEKQLRLAGIKTARLDSLVLLEAASGIDRAKLIANSDELNTKVHTKYKRFIKSRKLHKPLAYIVGNKEFYGYEFLVSNDVLTPRPESEALVELALQWANKQRPKPKSLDILDLGTGSGCLGICLSLELNKLKINANLTLSDISTKALRIARKNAAVHELHSKIIQLDVRESPLPESHVILANLPYVPPEIRYELNSPELAHEPRIALYADNEGLEFYQALFANLQAQASQSIVVTECLKEQLPKLKALAESHGYKRSKQSGLASLFSPIGTKSKANR